MPSSGPEQHENSNTNISPLLRPMSSMSMTSLCTCLTVGLLATGWCLLDYWNRQISADLFNIGNIRVMDVSESGAQEEIKPFSKFSYPLTLAFLQFAFMGVFFLVVHFTVNQERPADLRNLKLTADRRWPALLVTHIFSTFWLQALMMPSMRISIGLFASTRAAEIPIAAALRAQVLSPCCGRKHMLTIGLAFVAASVMFFAYAELAGCACVWSGHGVALSGVAFWIVYLMLLAMPAANCVCQEAIMLQPGMHPILLLALQNIFACLLFGPILMLAHLVGWEDVGAAFEMILTYSEVFMLVLWLCAQMAATSVLCITIIHITDAFWAIALRALRVVLWALGMLTTFYFADRGMPVSIACPHKSVWTFVLFCGVWIGAGAIYSDRNGVIEERVDKAQAQAIRVPSAKGAASSSFQAA